MPVANITEARDIVMGIINTAWAAAAEPAFWPTPGQNWPPPILWPDDESDEPDGSKPWAKVELQHQRGGQSAIGDVGKRRFRAWAVVTVTIYTPNGDGLTTADYLATIVQDALEGRHTPDKVYFRDVRVVDDGTDGPSYKIRVLSNLDYDRVK